MSLASSPLFIACSDLHISEKVPVFRSMEPDWLEAQGRVLRWLFGVQRDYNCPLVIAGDVFDRAIGTSLLVNFVIDLFPENGLPVYSVAGNHDLPYHNLGKLKNSSYGSLIRAGRVIDLSSVQIYNNGELTVAFHGFPYGVSLSKCEKHADIDVAVIHRFVWNGPLRYPYTTFTEACHIDDFRREMAGFDYYIFGDNHTSFVDGNAVNCGVMFRRARNYADYRPMVAVVYNDRIERLDVPIALDVDLDNGGKTQGKVVSRRYDFTEFFGSLRKAESLTCDVESLLQDYLQKHGVSKDVYTAIEALRGDQT